MADTTTAAKKNPPKTLEQKRAEFEQWERDREVRDLRKAVKVELAVLAKKLDECKTTLAIGTAWDSAARKVDWVLQPDNAKDDPPPDGDAAPSKP